MSEVLPLTSPALSLSQDDPGSKINLVPRWNCLQSVLSTNFSGSALNEKFPYRTARIAVVHDWRLGLLNHFFQFLCVIYVASSIVISMGYRKIYDPTGRVISILETADPHYLDPSEWYSYCAPGVYVAESGASNTDANLCFDPTTGKVDMLRSGCPTGFCTSPSYISNPPAINAAGFRTIPNTGRQVALPVYGNEGKAGFVWTSTNFNGNNMTTKSGCENYTGSGSKWEMPQSLQCYRYSSATRTRCSTSAHSMHSNSSSIQYLTSRLFSSLPWTVAWYSVSLNIT